MTISHLWELELVNVQKWVWLYHYVVWPYHFQTACYSPVAYSTSSAEVVMAVWLLLQLVKRLRLFIGWVGIVTSNDIAYLLTTKDNFPGYGS